MITLTKDKYLQPDELRAVISTLTNLFPRHQRDVLLIETALYSGAREGELLTITKDDLDPKDCSLFIKRPEKGSSQRSIPLPTDFFKRLYSYSRSINGPLFPISTSRVRQIWYEYRPINKKFHSLRHTFGRQMRERLSRGGEVTLKDAEKIQYLMGHKSITSTMIYINHQFETDSLRRDLGL